VRKHGQYLRYVLRHKWFVYQEGRKLGLGVWQLLLHDWTKFLPSEWFPYAEWFYGYKGGCWYHAPSEFQAGSNDDIRKKLNKEAFDRAWLLHQHRSLHHWQFWVLHEDSGAVKVLEMPDRYRREMLADWRGASRAIHSKDETAAWYLKTQQGRLLHPETQRWVETQLGLQEVRGA
jgi:hypothetical protein